MQATGVWEAFVRELAQRPDPPGVGLPPAPPAQPTAAQAGPAAELNAAFSAAEVRTGLQLLRNGRSAGSSGLPAEFLRYAYGKPSSPDTPAPHRLQPALAELYNSWFQAGAVPDAANVSLVTPIYKRGDAAEPSNYRPIAVGEPVTRLYAALLNVRLVAYTERAGLRAPSQAGFRPRLSTQHQLFCLQHLVDRATHLRQPLFCCFLDLKGAYDRVPRALLWQALQRLGVHGRMLGALQSLYSNAEYAINVGGRRGVGVRSTRGVKQGCPLSPTLFGLLLDGLHWALLAGAPGAGPQLACGRSVPDLGYADDFCLLATSPAHLQRLLDVAHGFLTSVGMELSVNKTCVMAFGVAAAAAAAAAEGVAWSCGGVRLERVEQYKYLGVTFSAAAGIAAAFPALRGRLYASWERLRRHFGTLHDGLSEPRAAQQRFSVHRCLPPIRAMANANASIDAPLIKVPFEALRRTTRDRKYVVDEMQDVMSALKQSATASCSCEERASVLGQLAERLQGLKRKLDDLSLAEEADAQRCRARLEHLAALGTPLKDHAIDWNRRRMDRLLVEYLLRCGYMTTATELACEAGIEDLVDTHIYASARGVLEALARHDCTPALAWCEANRPRLRKQKSKLEFKLRVQEFVELVRAERLLDALRYARAHLAPWAGAHLPELQRALAALAFRAGTACEPYAALFAPGAWARLADLFRCEVYRLHSLPPDSQLVVHLQAGLSALKTPQSYQGGCNREDPLHLKAFQDLAEGLPWSKHVHSKLVCALTREVMNEHNPPMVLPNGAVYSQKAIEQLASAKGVFMCPHTGVRCEVKDLRRAYIS
ncbi:hypothetical protein WJX81_007413 [Elliptochloris bilobata]|uniref:Macrophage erythroblast attacher n=1 Tax=Elliptochloris bilobata TaxID=381761 RepID=A0AAW1SCX8_9CHLO